MKKVISFIVGVACCLCVCMVNVSAEFIVNPNHLGTYYMLGSYSSFINIRTGGCDVHIVYDELENKFINASNGAGYMNNNYFRATYDAYSIVNQDGEIVRNVYDSTTITGTVDVTSDYIDIIVHGMIYEKTI